MKNFKRSIYVLSFIVLILSVFFRKDLPKSIDTLTLYLSGILLATIIIMEILTRKKWKKSFYFGYVIIPKE